MKVLIIKMSSMGDILHTLPALTDAINAIPNIRFDWIVEKDFLEIPTWHPAVRRVIPITIRHWRNKWLNFTSWREYFNFKKKMQQYRYDIVIDAQGLIKSAALITFFAKGTKHGMDYKSAREPISSWFYKHKHLINKQQHAVERIRQLFAISLNYRLPYTLGDYAIKSYFKAQSENYRYYHYPYLIFLHSTSCSCKNWPEIYWRKLIKRVHDAGFYIKLPWKKIHEKLRAQRLANGLSKVEVLPCLSLEQIARQLKNALIVVSIDTGLSHLAAALNKPNLTLYGPTNPKLIGTYGSDSQQIICSKLKTMATLKEEFVWQALINFINIQNNKINFKNNYYLTN